MGASVLAYHITIHLLIIPRHFPENGTSYEFFVEEKLKLKIKQKNTHFCGGHGHLASGCALELVLLSSKMVGTSGKAVDSVFAQS